MPPKVLLMDYDSHMDPEFTIKATTHNIHPYLFLEHLTHVLQPLDVGVFLLYKHWHKKAVQHATCDFDLEYNVASFMRGHARGSSGNMQERNNLQCIPKG